MDDVDAHLGVVDLGQLADGRLDGTDDVALEHEVEILRHACLQLGEDVLEPGAPRRLLGGELLAPETLAAGLCGLACSALVLDDARVLAGRRRLVDPAA